jgi:hypothetical protein
VWPGRICSSSSTPDPLGGHVIRVLLQDRRSGRDVMLKRRERPLGIMTGSARCWSSCLNVRNLGACLVSGGRTRFEHCAGLMGCSA